MPTLQSLQALPPESIDLLEAIGYVDAREFSESNPKILIDEVVKANGILSIMSSDPTEEDLKSWKNTVSELLEKNEFAVEELDSSHGKVELSQDKEKSPVDFESDPEIQSMLDVSLNATLVPSDLIKRNNLAVSDIPRGILLSECQGDVEMKIISAEHRMKHKNHTAQMKRSGLMKSRIRSFNEAEGDDHHVKPLEKGEQRDVVSLSEGLNKGLSPDSKRFVRGVLHPEPWSIRVSGFFAVLVQLFLVIAIFGIPTLIVCEQMDYLPNTKWWIVVIVSGLVLSALCYLFWGISARCRVCGQRQFAPKKCLKNRKAHHIPLIGYIFPTALHAMFFKWFYCTYCGTAVRLKK